MAEMWAGQRIAQAEPSPAKRVGRLLAIILLVITATAHAQSPAAAPASTTPALSPAEARGALAVLRDDKRRAELINTLDAIAKAAPSAKPTAEPAAPTAEPDAKAAAKPAAAPSIAPDSVGVQVAGRVAIMLSAYSQQLATSIHSVNDLPLLWRWIASQAADPVARAAFVDAGAKLLLVISGSLIAEWLVRLVFRRLRRTVDAWTPHHIDAEAPETAPQETEARQRRFQRVVRGLRQLPYLFGRLILDLVPVLVFVAAAELLLGTKLGDGRDARLVVLQAVQAYVYARVILAVATFLVSPAQPRLLAVNDWAASFLTRWTRAVVILAAIGITLSHIGALLGMFRTAELALLKLFMLSVHLCLVVAVLQARVPVAHRLRARRRTKGLWPTLRNRFADIWHFVAIFYIVGLWLVWAVEIRNGYERLLTVCGLTLAIGLGARLISVLLLGGLERLRTVLTSDGHPSIADRAGFYYPILRGVVTALIWAAALVVLLEAWGLPVLFWLTAGGLGGRVFDAALTVVVTVLLAIAVWEAANAAIAAHLLRLSGTAQLARAGRLRTLLPLLRTALLVTISLIVGMIVLSAIGVNIAPLLAGAGVIGIAVGFGSQKLVQDLITGLFLLLENAMQVGDVVTLGGLTGTVEALSVRTIRLRALDGAVHLIPFSSVTTVTNQTRDYSYAVLDISIGLNEEPAPIEQVLRDVAAEMQADPEWQSLVLDKLDVMGVEKLTDAAWILRVRMKTQPGSRWRVSRELNRRIKMQFDALAIESPFTSHKVLSREPPPAPATAAPATAAPVPAEQEQAA